MVHLLGAEMDAGHKIEWPQFLLSMGSQSLDASRNGKTGLYLQWEEAATLEQVA